MGGTVMAKVSCHLLGGGDMLEKHWSSGEYSHQNYPLRPPIHEQSLVPSLPPLLSGESLGTMRSCTVPLLLSSQIPGHGPAVHKVGEGGGHINEQLYVFKKLYSKVVNSSY